MPFLVQVARVILTLELAQLGDEVERRKRYLVVLPTDVARDGVSELLVGAEGNKSEAIGVARLRAAIEGPRRAGTGHHRRQQGPSHMRFMFPSLRGRQSLLP
jgi:hypothetical protein